MLLLHENVYKWTIVESSDSKKKDVWDSGEGSVIAHFDKMLAISCNCFACFLPKYTGTWAINVRVDTKLLCSFENYMYGTSCFSLC